MPPAASILSPLAVPFTPTRPGYEEYASFAAIYNDGIPEGIVVGNHADHDIIHNIPDNAIDEIFPPTATEAAELDALDDFLAAMVNLSFLEEHEEKTRSNIGHSFRRRWEARRSLGLVGKPLSATAKKQVGHAHGQMNSHQRGIVHFDQHRRADANIATRRHLLNAQRNIQIQNRQQRNRNGSNCGHSRPIQQPRKMNCKNLRSVVSH